MAVLTHFPTRQKHHGKLAAWPVHCPHNVPGKRTDAYAMLSMHWLIEVRHKSFAGPLPLRKSCYRIDIDIEPKKLESCFIWILFRTHDSNINQNLACGLSLSLRHIPAW
jgi:hypothetical protein